MLRPVAKSKSDALAVFAYGVTLTVRFDLEFLCPLAQLLSHLVADRNPRQLAASIGDRAKPFRIHWCTSDYPLSSGTPRRRFRFRLCDCAAMSDSPRHCLAASANKNAGSMLPFASIHLAKLTGARHVSVKCRSNEAITSGRSGVISLKRKGVWDGYT
jgi:hypothetical protein